MTRNKFLKTSKNFHFISRVHPSGRANFYKFPAAAALLAVLLVGLMPIGTEATSHPCSAKQMAFTISRAKIFPDETVELAVQLDLEEPGRCLPFTARFFWEMAGSKAILEEIKDVTPVAQTKFQTRFKPQDIAQKTGAASRLLTTRLNELAQGKTQELPISLSFITLRPRVLRSELIEIKIVKGSFAQSGPADKTAVPVTRTNTPGARGQAYSPNQILFTIKTDGSIYRAVAGQPAKIAVEIDLLASSPAKPKFDGTDSLARDGFADANIAGLYAAAGPAGATGFCNRSCSFLEKVSETKQAVSYRGTIELKTNIETTLGGVKVDLRAGNKMTLDIFPVIATAVRDEPFSNNGAKITVEVYEKEEQVKAAGGPVSGDRSTSTTTSAKIGESRSFGEMLTGGLISVVNMILGAIFGILRWIILFLGSVIFVPLLDFTLTMDAAAIASSPIYDGWIFVRDVVNMFFILFLIVIGLGTMLRIESYNYKKLLVSLIVMAMLVNFSFVIGRIIIQIADAAQFSFLPAKVDVVDKAGKITSSGMEGVKYLYQSLVTAHIRSIGDGFRGATWDSAQALGVTFSLIFQFILELGVVLTFAALAIFMLIRTVALWILLVISPLAYALFVLPATQGLAKKWWSTFLKYAFFAPIIAFFLRLALVLYQKGFEIFPKVAVDRQASAFEAPPDLISFINELGAKGDVTFKDSFDLALIYVAIIAFLWAGLIVTRQMGIAGADAVVGLAEKGMMAPLAGAGWAGKRGLGFAGQKWNEWTQKLITEKAGVGRKLAFAVLNPVAFARGWQERARERREEARVVAAGAGHDVASSFWTRGKERIPNKELAMRRVEREKVHKLREAMGEDIDKAEARDFFKRVVDVKGLEGDLLRGAYLKLVVAQGYGDDFTEVSGSDKYADRMSIPQDQRNIYNDRTFQTHAWATVGLDMDVLHRLRTDADFKKTGKYKNWLEGDDTQKKLRNLAELTNPAKSIGHYEQMYSAVRDETLEAQGIKAAFRPVIDEEFAGGKNERTDMILGETVKIPIRDFMRSVTWHNLIPKVFKDGQWKPGGMVDEKGNLTLTPYQVALTKSLGPEYIDQATHMQARTVKYDVGQWVNDDGSIKDPVQFNKLRDINAGLADVLKNIAVYGRQRPTKNDIETVENRTKTVRIKEITEREQLDERATGPLSEAYTNIHSGEWTHDEARAGLAAANIAAPTVDRIMNDITEALATKQSGLIVSTAYLPRDAVARITPTQITELSHAVQEGIKQGLAAGHKFSTAESQASLKVAIQAQIQPTLGQLNVAAPDIETISDSMAKRANTMIKVTPSGEREEEERR